MGKLTWYFTGVYIINNDLKNEMFSCILLISSNHMIFLTLQARAILLGFEKFSSAYLLQIALEII